MRRKRNGNSEQVAGISFLTHSTEQKSVPGMNTIEVANGQTDFPMVPTSIESITNSLSVFGYYHATPAKSE